MHASQKQPQDQPQSGLSQLTHDQMLQAIQDLIEHRQDDLIEEEFDVFLFFDSLILVRVVATSPSNQRQTIIIDHQKGGNTTS